MRVQIVKSEGDKSFELVIEDCTSSEAVSVIESVMIDDIEEVNDLLIEKTIH